MSKVKVGIIGSGNIGTDLIRGAVGGQEDWIVDVAAEMAEEKEKRGRTPRGEALPR